MKSEGEQSLEPGVGALLRASRLRCGEELQDVASTLRIRYPYLEALEDGRYEELPGASYAVGFVRSYAEHLGLDSAEVVRRFKIEAEYIKNRSNLIFPSPIAERGTPGAAIVFIGILLVAVAYGAWYVGSSRDSVFANIVPALPERLATLLSDDPVKPTPSDAVSATPSPIEAPESPAETPEIEPPVVVPRVVAPPVESTPSTPAANEPPVAVEAPAPVVEPVAMATPPAEPQIASEPAPSAPSEVSPTTEPLASTAPPEAPPETPQVAETTIEPTPEAPVESPVQIAEVPAAPEVPAQPALPVARTPTPIETVTPADLAIAEKRALGDASVPEPPVSETPTVSETVVAQPQPEPVAPVEQPAAPPEPAAPAESATPAEPVPVATPEPTAPEPATPEPATQVAAIPSAPEASNESPPAEPTLSTADGAVDIVVRAKSDSWIQVRDGIARRLLVTRLLRAGDSYPVPDRPGLTLLTGNAGALEILVGGKAVAPIGGIGAVRRNVALDAERLRAGTAVLD